MDDKRFALSEAVGAPVIYAAATALHFADRLTGGGTLAIIFGAVNESVWEHVKIFTAAYAGYAILQLLWIRAPFRRYAAAKCCGLYLLGIGMAGFYYLYTAIAGRSIIAVDVLYSAVLVVLAQLCSYKLTAGRYDAGRLFCPAMALIMLYYLMFFTFTVHPPRLELFRDPVSGGYGIIRP